MRYGKVVGVLLLLALLAGACSLARERESGTGGEAESTRVAMEATLTAMESTVAALTPTEQTAAPTQPAVTPTQRAAAPTQPSMDPTPQAQPPTVPPIEPTPRTLALTPTTLVPTPRPTPKTGPTDEELARKRLLEEQLAQNPRYPAEQVYFNNAVIFVYRVPNDLTDLGIFLGYKVTPAQRDALFSYPFYGSAKEIEGELFRWIWREGAVDYLKSQGAKLYWSEP